MTTRMVTGFQDPAASLLAEIEKLEAERSLIFAAACDACPLSRPRRQRLVDIEAKLVGLWEQVRAKRAKTRVKFVDVVTAKAAATARRVLGA